MTDGSDIRQGMQVLGSDGGMIGRVTGLHGGHIHVEPDAPSPGPGFFVVPREWIARVDEHVHLNRDAALARDTWTTEAGTAGAPPAADRRAATDPPARGSKWVWILGAVLLLIVLYLGLRGLDYAGREPDYENSANGTVNAPDA
jgi:hypothetical protein